ncbi:vWA domain-containing protein [Sorangium cellulosum]|uniref:vWA domain-containing protein n=1 Tax=Sorangium cellulosum TaxID=56 RepID=UPI0023DDB1FF|nr:VWA domain-containing protein [Sorangium cellulosum]
MSVVLLGGAGLIACSADDDVGGEPLVGEDPSPEPPLGGGSTSAGVGAGGSTSAGVGAGSSTSAGTGAGAPESDGPWDSMSAGAGGGGGAGEPAADPPPEPPPGEDPGAAQEFTCEGLDSSQPVVLYVSADDSNSMSSPVHARELLRAGVAPEPWQVRTYEFLNYYRIDYAPADEGELRVEPQIEPGEDAGTYTLQIGVRSHDPKAPRRPITVTFVLDTSGSMGGEPMNREKATVRAIAASLSEGDIVNMVTWNTSNAVVLSGHVVSGPDDPVLLDAADELSANGGTDLENGLQVGYELAQEHYDEGRINRVILVSDGRANVGVTSAELIATHAEDADKEAIYLVGVGTGPVLGYNDRLMDVVTDEGRGAYVYLDEVEEAFHMFRDRFDEVMEVAARGVQVELTLPWYFKMERFHGEEFSTSAEEIEPQHLAPGDAMIFNQVVRGCDAAVIDDTDTLTVRARWQTPITHEPKEASREATLAELMAGSKEQLVKGKAIVAYAEALKAGTTEALRAAREQVLAANPGGDPELDEIAELLALHPSY